MAFAVDWVSLASITAIAAIVACAIASLATRVCFAKAVEVFVVVAVIIKAFVGVVVQPSLAFRAIKEMASFMQPLP